MTERALVSVIVPVKNGEHYLADALGDVAAQTYDHHEIVVVDGQSTDRSAEIARSFPRVRLIEQPGDGLPAAWNLGLEEAHGELIAFLDSDDRWTPGKLEAQVDVLRRRPDVDYVVTHVRLVREPGTTPPPAFDPSVLDRDHVGNLPSALMARRSAFDAIGTFPTDYVLAADTDWFARAKDSDLVRAVIPEVMVHRRVHDSNLSYVAAHNTRAELLRLLRDSVARQRR